MKVCKGIYTQDNNLKEVSEEIKLFVKEHNGIAGHGEADHFAIYCRHHNDYQELYDRLQRRVNLLSSNINVTIRIGIMPWQEGLTPAQLVENAVIACSYVKGNYNEHVFVFDEEIYEKNISHPYCRYLFTNIINISTC